MTGRPALTVHQPYCGLIIAGFKPWETRPAPPAGDMRPPGTRPYPGCRVNRGDRIALHAAAAPPPRVMQRLGVGDWQIRHEDDGTWAISRPAAPEPVRDYVPLPLGVILGTAIVADALPIHDTCTDPIPDDLLYVTIDGAGLYRQQVIGDPWVASNVITTDLTDQLPLGNYSLGRWALLLEDIQATYDTCPWCLGHPVKYVDFACPVCDGAGHCPPVPAKGREGLWRWSPEATR